MWCLQIGSISGNRGCRPTDGQITTKGKREKNPSTNNFLSLGSLEVASFSDSVFDISDSDFDTCFKKGMDITRVRIITPGGDIEDSQPNLPDNQCPRRGLPSSHVRERQKKRQ